MAKVMKGRGDVDALAAKLERSIDLSGASTKLVYKAKRKLSGVKIVIMVFERYYMRNSSNTSLTILLTSDAREITADIIPAGGGNGLLGFDLGSEDDFEEDVIEILRKEDFK
ncbi:MAG: hypothetical protein E7218_02225 [Anaerofustis stercorihominis]|nr:hypothetical protein [Anaerofustis stercorihominis]